jgi:hypothetical protein
MKESISVKCIQKGDITAKRERVNILDLIGEGEISV